MKTILFVTGFDPQTRAKNLAYEFERYGRLVRLDIPPPKNNAARPYAFVEFEDAKDAEDALQEMHGRNIDGNTFIINWARPQYTSDYSRRPPHQKHYNRNGRSRSPYRRDRSVSPSRYNNDPSRRMRSRSRSPSNFQKRRSFSRSPPV